MEVAAFLIDVLAASDESTAYRIGQVVGVLLFILVPVGIIFLVIWLVRRDKTPVAPIPPPQAGPPPPGWHPDPQGQARLRYWDGARWTEHTQA